MKLTKKIIALLAVVTLLSSCFITAMAEESELVNVAIGSKLTSSGYDGNHMSAEALIDDNHETIWSSNPASNTWVALDLGRKYNIQYIQFVARQNLDQPETRNYYVIEVSNSPSFAESVIVCERGATPDQHGAIVNSPVGGKYRYVRYRKTIGTYSCFAELRVFVNKKDMPTTDVSTLDYNNRLNFLEFLGIDTTVLTDVITREQAAVVFAKAMNLGESFGSYFMDVKNPEATSAVNALCEANVISKSADGKFNPNRRIDYYMAVKMAVSALGCSVRAEYLGGYPSGYANCARELKILSGVSSEMKKADFLNLIFNVIDANVYDPRTITTDNIGYAQSNETFLERYHEIKLQEGLLEENYAFSTYLAPVGLSEDEVMIDGKKFYTEGEDHIELFGKFVKCYYKKETPTKNVAIYFIPEADQSEAIVSLRDFKRFNGNSIEAKNQDYGLDANYKLIKNGKRISPSNVGTLTDDGFINLIDNDGDSRYEIVRIIETLTKIVDSAKVQGKTTTLRFEDGTKATISTEKKSFVKYDNGDYGSVSTLGKNDIVSYRDSAGLFEAYVGNKRIESKMTAISDKEVVIDHAFKYPKSPDAVSIIAKNLNKYGTIYFDYLGNVFYFDTETTGSNGLGFWVGTGNSDPMTGDSQIKVYTDGGVFAIYNISAPITIDGRVYTDSTSALNKLTSLWNTARGGDAGLVIKYSVKAGNAIRTLDTPATDVGGEDDVVELVFDEECYRREGIIGSSFVADKNCVVFQFPKLVKEEEKFSVAFGPGATVGGFDRVRGYKTTDDHILPTIDIMTKGGAAAARPAWGDGLKTMLVVESVKEVYKNDDAAIAFTAYAGGALREYTFAKDFEGYNEHLSPGDTIMVIVGENNEIVNAQYLYNNGVANAPGASINIEGIYSSNMSYTAHPLQDSHYSWDTGYNIYNCPLYAMLGVFAMQDTYVHCRVTEKCDPLHPSFNISENKKDFIFNLAPTIIYVVDKDGVVRVGSMSDITTYQEDPDNYTKIFIRCHSGTTYEAVIYE